MQQDETKKASFRISVEALVIKEGKILLTRRADNCHVAPGVWNVPAGKAEEKETPDEAVVRECSEEIGMETEIVQLAAVRSATIQVKDKEADRLYYTYVMKPKDPEAKVVLNREHSAFVWVNREELESDTYSSLLPALKTAMLKLDFAILK